jgi:sucrose-6-phosphate hydrolase SacC (GH32 family)
VQLGNAKEVGWRLIAAGGAFTLVGFDREKQEIFIDRTHSGNTSFSKDFPVRTSAPLRLNGGQLRLRVLVDRSSVEVFAGDGLVAMTNLVFPSPGKRRIEFHSQGGPAGGVKTDFWTLGSIW